jgi:hypothetical protein
LSRRTYASTSSSSHGVTSSWRLCRASPVLNRR